jgi:adenine phosphoribosyltransferase
VKEPLELKRYIRGIPDFPKPGIMFRDITPLLAEHLALALRARFIPIRKPGKLPFDKQSFHYDLEYGTDSLEMHTDALSQADHVLLVDDLLATGGTMAACIAMVEKAGAVVVGTAFVIELDFLKGRQRLAPYAAFSLVHYADET